jgi:hypothetical protein
MISEIVQRLVMGEHRDFEPAPALKRGRWRLFLLKRNDMAQM